MATFRDYTEGVIVNSGPTESFTATEDIKMGQAVKLTAGSTEEVQPTDTTGERFLGFAYQTKAAGSQVGVALPGCIVRATSGDGNVDASEPVAAYTTTEGSVITATSGDYAGGTALAPDSGSNDDVLVLVTGEGNI